MDAKRSEHAEQREFVSWFRRNYPDTKIFAIPNGGARNALTGAKLKLEGVSAGVPDLFVPAHFLFIEMKKQEGGVVSAQQNEWIIYLKQVGYRVIIANGAIDAQNKFKECVKNSIYCVNIEKLVKF